MENILKIPLVLLYYLIMAPKIIFDNIKEDIEINKSIKEWEENSFEYNGGRLNKKFFVVENGVPKYIGDEQ